MRNPYDILGVKRSASLDEVKAAYRQACKKCHPDLGGSHEAMVELNTAYAFVLNELKQGYQRQEEEQSKRGAGAGGEAWHDAGEATRDDKRDDRWRDIYRDIDDELEAMRRAAEQYDEQLRTMRRAAWQTGHHAAWAKLTWDDLFGFLRRTARSGIKGVALLFAALIGVGSVLGEANFVSALILLGSGLGFAFSLALKSDKGGMLSAALLLFAFGFMTGGVLALYVTAVIVGDASQKPTNISTVPPQTSPPSVQGPIATQDARPTPTPPPSPSFARVAPQAAPPPPVAQPAPAPPEPRTLLAHDGATLKFVAGVPYHLKVRTGRSTSLRANHGTVKLVSGEDGSSACVDSADFPLQSGAGPWREIERIFRACGDDAIMTVQVAP